MKKRFMLFVFVGILLTPSLLKAAGGAIRIKTLRPSSMSYIYYTLKDSQGKTLVYQRVSGSRSDQPVSLSLQKVVPGQLRLDTSYGKFVGYMDGNGKVRFSHPYLRSHGQELTILNRLTLQLTIRTSLPSIIPRIQYLFLSNSGLVIRKTKKGALANRPTVLIVRNIIPCYGHLSTSFGQFVLQIQNDHSVSFIYRGAKRMNQLEASIEAGSNTLHLKGVLYTGKPTTTVHSSIQARFQIPDTLEANEKRGVRILLDGKNSKAPSGSKFYWKFPGGFRPGIKTELSLPLGRHTIYLSIYKGTLSHTCKRTISVVDTTPPQIQAQYQPETYGGASLYRLALSAEDLVDPCPRLTAKIPFSPRQLQGLQGVIDSQTSLGFSPQGIVVHSPNPPVLLAKIRAEKGLVIQPGSLLEIQPSQERFRMSWREDGSFLWEGKIPKLLISARDKSNNKAKIRLAFEISLQTQDLGAKKNTPNAPLEQGPAPWEILISVFFCVLLVGVLFLWKKGGERI